MESKDSHIKNLIDLALSEDIGTGDMTSQNLIPASLTGKAVIIAKQKGTIAGLEVAKKVFQSVDSGIVFKYLKKDGDRVKAKDKIALIQGKVRSILTAERTALNFLQRLSGIASLTAKYVEKIKGMKTKILDTRKTTPGMRILEKYAVKMGGGENHRMGLYDMILIKGNHIKATGGISKAVKKAKRKCGKIKIEVEVRDFKEAIEASLTDADWIMLDNMNVREMGKTVSLIRSANRKIKIEASGGVTLKNVRDIALTGVDYISVGALTHSAPALDLSLILMD
jgi:nicotinate-nucleotide pyrophosphorylase (carboxylating)